jgi:hypothetical protein
MYAARICVISSARLRKPPTPVAIVKGSMRVKTTDVVVNQADFVVSQADESLGKG